MRQEHPQLAMTSPRLFEDFRLTGESLERIREVGTVISAYESILADGFTYVSTPITSGAVLYRAMRDAGVGSPAELQADKDFFYRNVVLPNLKAAEAVSRRMMAFGGAVISPAAFEAKSLSWSQGAYMALWLTVLEAKTTRIAMVEGWEYSNGGAQEYLHALLMQAGRRARPDIAIVDHRGEALDHARAIDLLAGAIGDLHGQGFVPTELARVLHRVIAVHGMVADEFDYGIKTDQSERTNFRLGAEWFECAVPADVMRSHLHEIRDVRRVIEEILPANEASVRSSAAMTTQLVREDGRSELLAQPASVLTSKD